MQSPVLAMEAIVSNAKSVPKFLPKRDLTSLKLNVKYHVLGMKFVKTKFGESIVVDLEDDGTCPQPEEGRFYVYLPKRWADVFTEEQLKAVKPCVLSLCVTSHVPLPNEKTSVQLDIDYVSMFLV